MSTARQGEADVGDSRSSQITDTQDELTSDWEDVRPRLLRAGLAIDLTSSSSDDAVMVALSGSVGDLSVDHGSTGLAVVAAATSVASPTGVFDHGAAASFSFAEEAEHNVPLANERGVEWTAVQDTMPQATSRDQHDNEKRPRRNA